MSLERFLVRSTWIEVRATHAGFHGRFDAAFARIRQRTDFARQRSSAGWSAIIEAGSWGGPRLRPTRDQLIPSALTESHTTKGTPFTVVSGTPPPCPPRHIRESWEFHRLSPTTNTSSLFTTYGPQVSPALNWS